MRLIFFFICIFLSLLISKITDAQSTSPDVIASAGDHFISASGSVSWTIGEPVTDTYASPANILTKGFQQPNILSLSGIGENNPGSGLYAYPNPVDNELSLDFSKMKSDVYQIAMYDVAGQIVKYTEFTRPQGNMPEVIPMESIGAGIYLLHISSSGNENIVLRIIKL
ncbi:MAG: T9SS type A sorting domain-containing protein [Bacteroidia bacterium]